jgi:hypothetical protein
MAMYSDMAKQIVERKSIFAGRTMEYLKSCLGVRPASSLDRNLGFPVEALKRLTLRWRIMTPDVSLMRMRDMMKNAPATIATNPKGGVQS